MRFLFLILVFAGASALADAARCGLSRTPLFRDQFTPAMAAAALFLGGALALGMLGAAG